MDEPQLYLLLFFSLFIIIINPSALVSGDSQNDAAALLAFRSSSDPHGTLLSNWTPHSHPCSSNWFGVGCSGGRVFSLSLPSHDLRGPLAALAGLDQLRLLDLHDNRLNGTVSALADCRNLKLVYLSGNDLEGEVGPEMGQLRRLLRLDLADNNLSGALPDGISNLTRLITLRLENNAFSGRVPELLGSLSQLRDLNVSNNELSGQVPDPLLRKFGPDSFLGNEQLCGSSPLRSCSFKIEGPDSIPTAATAQKVPSNPSSLSPESPRRSSHQFSHGVVVTLFVVNSILAFIILSFIVAFCCRRQCSSASPADYADDFEAGKRRSSYGSEKRVYASNGESDVTNGSGDDSKSRLVFFERRKQFELEELLRASAEMLGKGSLGTVYRAVLEDGSTVAVKRLKDANPCARKEFEQYMEVIGRMKHPNIVRLRAYYYAREEKLLVYDYMANGSLHALLHENRGPGRIPLDWTTRISLVLGAAQGLARIHAEYSASKIPHGNIKSSNVLLDKNGAACIADFGLSLLLNPAHAVARLGGYRAPEQPETKRLSQQADVYAFGILLLEVLTGRAPTSTNDDVDGGAVDLPKWVGSVVRDEWTAEVFDPELLRYKNIEEELVAMLHVAMACVAPAPEKRPTMAEVAKMIEEIRVEQSPIGGDYDESRDSMSPSIPTTEEVAVFGY